MSDYVCGNDKWPLSPIDANKVTGPKPCDCLAYDPVENAHTEAEHWDCGGLHYGEPCGGCDSCVGAQIDYYRRRGEEA